MSAAERLGLPLDHKDTVANLGRLIFFAAQNGIRPERCVSGSLTDLTPSSAIESNFHHVLQVEEHDPPEAGVVHLFPKSADAETLLLGDDGSLLPVDYQTVRIPEDQQAYIWLAPTRSKVGLKLVELITSLPERFIAPLDDMAQEFRPNS